MRVSDLVISGRADLPEAVTDVIVDRRVIRKLASHTGARFSETGYAGMVAHAEADDELIEMLGLRIDLPIKFLRDLLRRATDAVRDRLIVIAPPELQEEIKRVLKTIADAAGRRCTASRSHESRSRSRSGLRGRTGLRTREQSAGIGTRRPVCP